MNPALLDDLRAALDAGAVLAGDEVANRAAGFMQTDKLQARVLVRPRTTQQVAAVLRLCHAAGQPVVTHGGLTGLVHGADATPDDLVLSLERMNAIEEIDPLQRVALAQAGVTLQALQEAADEHDLSFPLDLGARGSATLGGNASTNAGGNRVIRYGMMREMVLGIEAVLADGTVVSSLNRMIKNNAGYDLKQLFIGSEGTLGVVTRLVLRLREKPRSQDVAMVAVAGFDRLAALLKHMDRALGGGLTAYEAMWRECYELLTTPPALSRPAVPHGHPYYVLVESMGADAARDSARFGAALETAWDAGLVADAAVAGSDRERAAMWAIRDDVMQMVRDGAPFIFDVSLPIFAMEAYVEEVRTALAARWPEHRCWVFGHLGDGNLHLVIRAGAPDAETRSEVERLVYGPLERIGGSVSAEHGVGLEKKPYLWISRHPEEIELMRTIKRSLDPRNILNPGKIF
jgi:FAD/FMN-containing dehydrogenase